MESKEMEVFDLALKLKMDEVEEIINTLSYAELTKIYTTCLNVSKIIRLAPNFERK